MNKFLTVVSLATLTFCLAGQTTHAMEEQPKTLVLKQYHPKKRVEISLDEIVELTMEPRRTPKRMDILNLKIKSEQGNAGSIQGVCPAWNEETFPQLLLMPNLTSLTLHRNEDSERITLKNLPTTLTNLFIFREDIEIAASAWKNLTGLTYLKLGYTPRILDVPVLPNLQNFSFHALHEVDRLGKFTRLTTLNLSNIDTDGEFLPNLPNLTFLDLSMDCKVSDRNLGLLTGLQGLTLHSNKVITDDSVGGLTGLTKLNLPYNTKITDAALRTKTNLKNLNLYANHTITAKGVRDLCNLQTLNLGAHSSSDFEKDSVPIGPDCIKNLTNLTDLDLYCNTLICKVDDLTMLTALTKLELHNNKIEVDPGYSRLREYLPNLTTTSKYPTTSN